MANSIALSKVYTNLLDEVYQQSSLTAVLESDATLIPTTEEYAISFAIDGPDNMHMFLFSSSLPNVYLRRVIKEFPSGNIFSAQSNHVKVQIGAMPEERFTFEAGQ